MPRGLTLPASRMTAFDIGGGSTEYVVARGGTVDAAVSLRLGVVPLAERFVFPDRVEPARYDTMLAEVMGRLTEVGSWSSLPSPERSTRVMRATTDSGDTWCSPMAV